MKQLDVRIEKQEIDNLFTQYDNQGETLIALYKMIVPMWDKIAKLHDYPKCNDYTWKYICCKFQALDKKYHPSVLPGGCWMNSGFTIDNTLSDFMFEPCAKIQYKGDKNPIMRIFINYAWQGNVRIGIERRYNSNSYTVKYFSQFAKMLQSKGYTFKRLESNPKVCYFGL